MRRLLASAVLLAAIAVGAFALLWRSEALQDRLVDAVIARRAVADRTDLLSPDHLDLSHTKILMEHPEKACGYSRDGFLDLKATLEEAKASR